MSVPNNHTQTNQPPFPTGLNYEVDNWIRQFLQNVNAMIVPTPAHDNSTGTAGQFSYDESHFYVCIATNTWTRVAITGGF